MRALVKSIKNKFWPGNFKSQSDPYEYLLSYPRYQKIVVDLLGEKFEVADSQSFYWSYKEIFLENIYKFNSSKRRPVIIDCGSNYGASIVYFKELFPDANIVGVEADPVIYKLLENNINQREYDNVMILNKAISSSSTPVKFYHEGADAGRLHQIDNRDAGFVIETVNLDDLIKDHVDFLKMDIEGAEADAICTSKKLNNIDQLFIEYHSFDGAEQLLGKILETLTANGFRYYIRTQFCSPRPLTEKKLYLGMDLQLNIFAKKENEGMFL